MSESSWPHHEVPDPESNAKALERTTLYVTADRTKSWVEIEPAPDPDWPAGDPIVEQLDAPGRDSLQQRFIEHGGADFAADHIRIVPNQPKPPEPSMN